MEKTTLLNGQWDLREEIISCAPSEAPRIARASDGWIPTPVPGDIHQGLIAAGRITEPLLGINCFDCEWTEHRSWWFRRQFDFEPQWGEAEVVELEMDGLDSAAEIFLNDVHVGSHSSAFRPFVASVKPHLQPGRNVLLVRLSAGVENVSEAQYDSTSGVYPTTQAHNGRSGRGDERRGYVRKPQYSFGWDWSPRVATTAIYGDVILRAMTGATVRDVALRPVRHGSAGEVLVHAAVLLDRFDPYSTAEGRVHVTLRDALGVETTSEERVLVRSGHTTADFTLTLREPRLWWPIGLGEQHLYRVEATLTLEGRAVSTLSFDYGVRFVELDTDGAFAFVINGRRVFARGANWIPADAIYARVTEERYRALVRDACEANFNMLRVWGGGLYEHEAFYRACDEAGILVWQDFAFACAPYPDHLDSFRVEVEREADHQTRRLRRHASLALWSGNNENTWGLLEWWHDRTRGGAFTYNYILPDAVRRNSPEIPYWNGSPYGGAEPNAEDVGDRHHWGDCMMSPDMAKRITPEEYDKCQSLFLSEFGYVGVCSKETVMTYLDGAPADRQGEVWLHHNNVFEKNTVVAGIRKHYADPEGLTLDEYLLYSGLCQGLMYQHALDSARYRPNCHGALFWMFSDCWGEVGWTITDYYLRRKISWYFVRRAFSPVRLILRAEGEAVRVIVANDTPDDLALDVEMGYVTLDGSVQELRVRHIPAPAFSRTEAGRIHRAERDPLAGLWVARVAGNDAIPAGIFRAADFRQLRTGDPGLEFAVRKSGERDYVASVTAVGYAHAVHLDVPKGAVAQDDYFDLLPGEAREIRVSACDGWDPKGVRVACLNGAGRRLE